MITFQSIKSYFADLFADDSPDDIIYDPVQVAGVLVGSLAALGALYWMLWAVLVCEGGLAAKIGPALHVLFSKKTLLDFDYRGYPYQLGIFEGWIVNVGGLVVCLITLVGLWFMHRRIIARFPLNQNQ